jgi:tRNA(fMet)-specific endonuclease VapC
MLHLLDTDTASYIIKRHSADAREKLDALDPRQVAISAITQAELFYGLQRLSPGNRLHLVVREFLDATQILAWPAEAAEFYAQIRHQLTREGQPIGDLDMMIASHALSLRATLVTNNTRHYSRIAAPLILTNWIDEQDV